MIPERDDTDRLTTLLEAIADSILQMSDEEIQAELAEEGPRPGPSVGEIIAAQLQKHRE